MVGQIDFRLPRLKVFTFFESFCFYFESVLRKENKILLFLRFYICRFNFQHDASYIIIPNQTISPA